MCIRDRSETFHYEYWTQAFEETGIDLDFYTTRERPADEILPWDFIDIGVTKKFLLRELEKSKAGIVTQNCRAGCSGCGAGKYQGGVCIESKN